MNVGSHRGAVEIQFVIRFRREVRANKQDPEIWRGKIMLVPRRASSIPESDWAQQWVQSFEDVPAAMHALLAKRELGERES